MWGLFQEESNKPFVKKNSHWFHAVSFGEAKIALEFLKEGVSQGQDIRNVCFTTTIEDAMVWFKRESKKLDIEGNINCYFLPLDFFPVIYLFVKRVRPTKLFLCETDIWPILLFICKQSKVPVYLINGRISNSLSKNLLTFQKSSIKILQAIDQCFVQYPSDKNKLQGLIKLDKIHIYGNAKFDLLKPCSLPTKYSSLKLNERQTCILGSFHIDEYKHFLKSFKQFTSKILFVIAPRNLSTIEKATQILEKNGLSYDLSSQLKSLHSTKDIIVLDEMGVLSHLYNYCNISFIGGSFNKVGGHNFLEPILYKKPVFVGPFFRNYEHDIQEFVKLNYIWQVNNEEEIVRHFSDYMHSPKPYIESSLKANQHLRNYQGVLDKTWKTII